MNRGFGSHGLRVVLDGDEAAQVGVIVVYERVVPSDRPPFSVRAIVR